MSDSLPWYHAGLRFECMGCGRCCCGEPGYVYVIQSEIDAMAAEAGLDVSEFEKTFVRRVGKRRSLVELPNGDCVFFDSLNRRCRVYAVRPRQCRTWPFWTSNLRTPEAWKETCRCCRGANHGPLVPLKEIQARLEVVRV